MPLQDTDVTLVSRGATNANASMTQVKDYVLDGLTSTNALVWSEFPTTANNHISSPNSNFEDISSFQLRNRNIAVYGDNDIIVLTNLATSSAGTYRVTGRIANTNSVTVEFIARSNVDAISVDDRMVISNLGPDVDTDTQNEVIINENQPTGENGDLWYQPSTGLFFIFNGDWERINSYNGPYYQNVVDDLGIDNTGSVDVGGAISEALRHMFNQIPQRPVLDYDGTPTGEFEDAPGAAGTLYFPAGVYLLETAVFVETEASRKRASWVIKGDGMSTKFYVRNNNGGIGIRFLNKDNYLTVQDLAIHPKQVCYGHGLYLQNGRDEEIEVPEEIDTDDNDVETIIDSPAGGSNQQYGVQIVNVSILSDEDKPNNEFKKSNALFFRDALALINFGRPRLERVITWNHAERSNFSLANPQGIDYSGRHRWTIYNKDGSVEATGMHDGYGWKPEEEATSLKLTNCYSPWVDNCYFNGTARYGIYWNSARNNTEGGTFSKLVINGADIGFWVAQARIDRDDDDNPIFDDDGNPVYVQGRHPHLTVIDSHINSARFGIHMNNVKYFHLADILFYARNDKKRDVTLIDCQLINCHSGILSNGYSGGALGNTEKKAIPEDEEYDFSGMSAAERKVAEKNSLAKSPSRIHVKLIGTDDIDRPAGIQKNRSIIVKDNNLNAYMCRTDSSNRTAGRVKDNGQPVAFNSVDWKSPYQVEGPCEDVHIILPNASYEGNAAGSYDNSEYPPKDRMITSIEGPVYYKIGSTVSGLISDDISGEREVRERLELKNKNPKPGDAITSDTFKANVGNGSAKTIAPFVTIRTNSQDVTPGKEYGSYTINTAINGDMKNVFHLEDGIPYFPINDIGVNPVLSFNNPGQSTKPAIYYLEGGQPNGTLDDAAPGSLCLKNNGSMWFKTPGASNGWKEVQLGA